MLTHGLREDNSPARPAWHKKEEIDLVFCPKASGFGKGLDLLDAGGKTSSAARLPGYEPLFHPH